MAEENIVDREYTRASEIPDIETSKSFDRRVRKLGSKARKSINENKNAKLHLVEKKTGESDETVKEMTVRSAKRGARVFVLVAALIALFSVTATGINPFQEKIRNFFIETFSAGSIIQFDDNNPINGTLYSEYTYMPEGYELSEKTRASDYEKLIFSNADGAQIVCVSVGNDSSLSSIDTENMTSEEVYVNALTAIYYSSDDFAGLLWSNGEHYYSVYTASNDISKSELIKIAESRENVHN